MARPTRKAHAATLAFDALTLEGALIAPAMLARIADQKASGQADSDYNIPKGLTLRDEIARYFRIGQALFTELSTSGTLSATATTRIVEALLRDVFGFGDINRVGTRAIDERQYSVTLEARGGRVPVVVVPPSDELDAPSPHLPSEGRRRSAASALQDWLNTSEGSLWGLSSNGVQLRLLRANANLTRPAFIQADLRRIFEGEAFADFAVLWLLVHASRFGVPGAALTDCALEQWREAGAKEGIAARERLRAGVEAALLSLGGGLVGHPDNATLRERLANGTLPLPEYFGQLLRLVYRLIFLLAAEDRNLLHAPAATAAARRLYAEGYSVGRLRDHAVRRAAWDRHHDRWEGLLITLAALAGGEPRLGLPALGGLFEPGTIPDLEGARLANRDLMAAIYRLAWLKEPSGLVPVNWRDMQTEELGSVYESLLELTPRLTADGRGFAFAEAGEAKGNARKTTGSYYTPDSLVQTLLDSALDPVLDRVEAEADDPDQALLSVTVIDPACGSGHFLLSAARRIAARVARHRTGGVASADDYRHALREVVRACIHGVDRNPLAVELTKVALWIETVEPGKPLGFLDANIRCGDSLLGVFDLDALRHGIPDAAYKPLTGVLGWRDITSAHVLRTVIATAFPRLGVGNSLPLMLFGSGFEPQKLAALIGSLSSMTCDFSARHKVGGTHLNYFIYQQLPVLPPSAYTAADFACLVPRVLELTYTSHSMAPFARDLGYDGPPFVWDEDRRAQLRAELDAWYARAYGLTRNELRYILDPADVRGPDYPSETFRVLKNNEKARWGEYRTGRLVLAAWDAQEARPAAAQ